MEERRRIDEIVVGTRFRRDLGDLTTLKQSITDVGLLHPIIIKPNGELIAGQRRLEACRELGWETIPVRVIDPIDVIRAEHDENVVRKDFLPSEMVAIAKALEPEERKAAEKRIMEGAKLGPAIRDGKPIPVENFHGVGGKTRDKVATYVGVSGRTLEKAAKVIEAAEAEPEKFKSLAEEMDRTGKIDGAYQKLRRLKKIEEQKKVIEEGRLSKPDGLYDVIVVDPPWDYGTNDSYDYEGFRGLTDYPVMSLEEIVAIELPATDDCVLWLWTTHRFIRHCFPLLDKWGFQEKAILTWAKNRFGIGKWLRSQTEYCIMAVKGEPVINLTNQSTLLIAPVREHSRKPDEFYQLVDSLCVGRKLDYFGREKRSGWDIFGIELFRREAG